MTFSELGAAGSSPSAPKTSEFRSAGRRRPSGSTSICSVGSSTSPDPLTNWKSAIAHLGDRLERDYLEPARKFARGFGTFGSSTMVGYEIPLGGRVGKVVGGQRRYARKLGLFGLFGPRVITRDLAEIEAEFRVEIEAWLTEQERRHATQADR